MQSWQTERKKERTKIPNSSSPKTAERTHGKREDKGILVTRKELTKTKENTDFDTQERAG